MIDQHNHWISTQRRELRWRVGPGEGEWRGVARLLLPNPDGMGGGRCRRSLAVFQKDPKG